MVGGKRSVFFTTVISICGSDLHIQILTRRIWTEQISVMTERVTDSNNESLSSTDGTDSFALVTRSNGMFCRRSLSSRISIPNIRLDGLGADEFFTLIDFETVQFARASKKCLNNYKKHKPSIKWKVYSTFLLPPQLYTPKRDPEERF